MSIVEQCAANVRAKTGLRMPYAEEVLDILAEFALLAQSPTEAMLIAARDWSAKKYGTPIGSDAATGCWQAMSAALLREAGVSGGGG